MSLKAATAISLRGPPRLTETKTSRRSETKLARTRCSTSNGVGSKVSVVFEPMKEVKEELFQLPKETDKSLARLNYHDSSECAINEQINVLYSLSYIYHSLYAFFDRDNEALPGFAHYFRERSEQRRSRAEDLIGYQNERGGRVKLSPIVEAGVEDVGEARKHMELALSLEKVVTDGFYVVHKVADERQDKHMKHLVKSKYLAEQMDIIQTVAEYVAQLRRIGDHDGFGTYYFDRVLT